MKRWKINTAIATVLALWTFWPVASVVLASSIASIFGAQLDEGSSHPCVVMGVDLGDTLYTLFVLGWAGFLTLPTGVFGFLIFGIAAATEWMLARRRARRAQAPKTI